MNCYARHDIYRLAGNPNPKISRGKAELVVRSGGTLRWTGALSVNEDRIEVPLHWREPRMIFVNSLSDLFYGGDPQDKAAVPWEAFVRMMDVIRRAPQHIYQILTKRPARMVEWLDRFYEESQGATACSQILVEDFYAREYPHVWWGISAGTQSRFVRALGYLRRHPGAVRWISAEPLLERIETTWRPLDVRPDLDWLVVGGESARPGERARPTEPAWIRGILGAGRSAGTPVFVKQLGQCWAEEAGLPGKGDDVTAWPLDLQVQQWPEVRHPHSSGAKSPPTASRALPGLSQ